MLETLKARRPEMRLPRSVINQVFSVVFEQNYGIIEDPNTTLFIHFPNKASRGNAKART